MTRPRNTDSTIDALLGIRSGRESISDLIVLDPMFNAVREGSRTETATLATSFSNLVTVPNLTVPTMPDVRPSFPLTPLLDAVTVVDDVTSGVVKPITVAFTSASDEVAYGDEADEATLTYASGGDAPLPTISHQFPLHRGALKHTPTLRSDIDTFLTGGLLVKVEDRVAAALAAAVGTVPHAFDGDIATTVRTAIAAAQSAFRELGVGAVTALLSPLDHAELDLAGHNLSEWPARILSSPAVPTGTAFVGRFKLAVQVFVSPVYVSLGYIDDQFTRNTLTAMASVEAFAHVAAPSSIIVADLDGSDDLS